MKGKLFVLLCCVSACFASMRAQSARVRCVSSDSDVASAISRIEGSVGSVCAFVNDIGGADTVHIIKSSVDVVRKNIVKIAESLKNYGINADEDRQTQSSILTTSLPAFEGNECAEYVDAIPDYVESLRGDVAKMKESLMRIENKLSCNVFDLYDSGIITRALVSNNERLVDVLKDAVDSRINALLNGVVQDIVKDVNMKVEALFKKLLGGVFLNSQCETYSWIERFGAMEIKNRRIYKMCENMYMMLGFDADLIPQWELDEEVETCGPYSIDEIDKIIRYTHRMCEDMYRQHHGNPDEVRKIIDRELSGE